MKELHFSAKDNGAIIQTDPGTVIIVTLDGNPTTGFEWVVDEADQNIVKNIHSVFNKTEGAAVGMSGVYVFTASVVEQGSVKLSFKYRRRWEGDSSVLKRFGIQLNVV
jgi:inhibitor of cysteine peptidase